METLTKPQASIGLQEAKNRARRVRYELDKVLSGVLSGAIDSVATLEASLKEVESTCDWVTSEELVLMMAPRLRVLWMRGKQPHGILTGVAPDVRTFLGFDLLVDD